LFGGGRRKFLRDIDNDYMNRSKMGERKDGRNLISEWQQKMNRSGKAHKFIWNLNDFENLNTKDNEYVMGLNKKKYLV
jgi:alkaline phosphatase